MTKKIHIIVSGRVQGVCFRAATQKQAEKLSITGLVRNLPDGCVEIFAEGATDALTQFERWCHKGPLLAKVDKIEAEKIENQDSYSDFTIR